MSSSPLARSTRLTQTAQLAAFLAAYAVTLLVLLPQLSYWFDEVTDLMSIRDVTGARLMGEIAHNPGGVPLSYLFRAFSIHLFGPSPFGFRLPSALFSLAACTGIFVLARQLGLRYPVLAALLFAAIPLQLRYAVESRPYSQALSISIWMTVVFLALVKQSTIATASLYFVLVVVGLYSQPFTVFVPVAHFAWLLWKRWSQPQLHQTLLLAGCALALAALAFLPWQLQITRSLHQTGASSQHYELGIRVIPLIVHEVTGAGYWGTLLLALLAGVGWAALPRPWAARSFWALYVVVPILLAIAVDLKFHYFFATRQLITILAPLAVLGAMGGEYLLERRLWLGRIAFATLLITFIAGDIHWFRKPRENWEAASAILQQAASHGSCVIFASDISAALLHFFAPHLSEYACSADPAQWPPRVALAIDPYGPDASRDARRRMIQSGYRRISTSNLQGPVIEFYQPQ